jgi:protein-disulfide isomerase
MEPLIDELENNGCQITEINIQEHPDLALSNDVHIIPTIIIGDERITGEFTLSQVKDLIDNQL